MPAITPMAKRIKIAMIAANRISNAGTDLLTRDECGCLTDLRGRRLGEFFAGNGASLLRMGSRVNISLHRFWNFPEIGDIFVLLRRIAEKKMDKTAEIRTKRVGNWMTLSEVAEWLGIHASTVRHWADRGYLPSHRTQGGHRRFQRSELELWAKAQRMQPTRVEADELVQSALAYTRLQISEGALASQAWYQKLDAVARSEYARSGRKLLQGLTKFIASNEELGQAEARAMGYDYANLGRRHGLDAVEATRAFLFFRNALLEALLASYEGAAIRSAQAWADMARKMDAFTSQVLLSLLETYQALEKMEKK